MFIKRRQLNNSFFEKCEVPASGMRPDGLTLQTDIPTEIKIKIIVIVQLIVLYILSDNLKKGFFNKNLTSFFFKYLANLTSPACWHRPSI